jgi:hypothetical protein
MTDITDLEDDVLVEGVVVDLDTDADFGEAGTVCLVADPCAADEGEVMWFTQSAAAGASVVNVPAAATVIGVNFLYENRSVVNTATYDHIDAAVAKFFADMLGHWAETPAANLASLGTPWVTGCTTTPLNFCPEGNITRAEFAAIVGREVTAGAIPVVVTAPYGDVPTSYWAAGYIQALKVAGIIMGNGAGNFNPEATISRSEAAAMLARWSTTIGTGKNPLGVDLTAAVDKAVLDALDVPAGLPAATLAFIDVPTTYWAAREISALVKIGVVKGTGAGTFAPEANLTRAEMVALVDRLRLAEIAVP